LRQEVLENQRKSDDQWLTGNQAGDDRFDGVADIDHLHSGALLL